MGPDQSSSSSQLREVPSSRLTARVKLSDELGADLLTANSRPVMSASARLLAAGVVGFTLIAMLVGTVLNVSFLRGTATALFLLLELGIAPTLMMRPMSTMWFAFRAITTGLTATILVGFVMSALHFWHPMQLFILAIVATLAILVFAVRRDMREVQPEWTSGWRSVPSITWRINGTVAAGLAVVIIVALTNQTNPAQGGLISTLGIGWCLGLFVMVAGLVWALKAGISPAFAVLAIAGVVVLSQAITYGAPAVMSAARHVGFTQFIRVNGGVQIESDIFQAWSGLFAGIAWVADAGGISDPMVIATWWPVALSPVLALGTAVMASRWIPGNARIWLAGLVFILSSTLNVIYFSPQSVGLLMAIAIFALGAKQRAVTARPAVVNDDQLTSSKPPQIVDQSASPDPDHASSLDPRSTGATTGSVQACDRAGQQPLNWSRVALIFYLSCGMAVTHQISPYLTVAALAVLSVFKFVRPWWLPVVVLLPAVAWAWLNRSVLGGFVSLGAIGRLWDNVQPPSHSFAQFPQPAITRLAFYFPALVLFLVGLLAVITAVRWRSRCGWALLIAAASPASLFAATDYGQEGIFRVALFAGPWLAVLAAGLVRKRSGWPLGLLSAGLVVLLGTNAFGQTALDWNRMIRQDTAAATRLYETTANKDSLVLLTGTINATPLGISGQYQDVRYLSRESLGGYPPVGAPYDAAVDVTQLTKTLVKSYPSPQYYALVSDSIGAYDDRYGFQPYDQYVELTAAMAQSPLWNPIFQGETTTLYVLIDPAAVASMP